MSSVSSQSSRFFGPRPLVTLGLVLVALAIVVVEAPHLVDAYRTPLDKQGDFGTFYYAGKLATHSNRADLYTQDIAKQQAWTNERGFRLLGYMYYPPVTAIAMVPISQFSKRGAVGVWRVFTAIATAGLAFLVARSFRDWGWRVLAFVCVVFWPPLLLNVEINQIGAFSALLVVGGTLLYLSQPVRGALLLSLLAIKPSSALGPGALIVGADWRKAAYFVVPFAVLVLAPFLIWGPSALSNWRTIDENLTKQDLLGHEGLLVGLPALLHLGSVWGMELFAVLGIGVVLLVNRLSSRMEVAAALALLAGFLLNPHSLLYDAGVCFGVVIMLRRLQAGWDDERSDWLAGGVLLTLFVAGDWTWRLRGHIDAVPPLTIWAILAFVAITAFAFYLERKKAAVAATEANEEAITA